MKASKLLANVKNWVLYHGTIELNLVLQFGKGKLNNDYGRGFYTTPNRELGAEWAYAVYHNFDRTKQGYLYEYHVYASKLSILDLTKLEAVYWIAELLSNRRVMIDDEDGLIAERIDLFVKKYKLDTSDYDVIIGYRADDKYFSYVSNFVLGTLSYESLCKALRCGNLGLQVFFKSRKAFNILSNSLYSCNAVSVKYADKYRQRDNLAVSAYRQVLQQDKYLKNKHTIFDFIGD